MSETMDILETHIQRNPKSVLVFTLGEDRVVQSDALLSDIVVADSLYLIMKARHFINELEQAIILKSDQAFAEEEAREDEDEEA